MNIFKMYKRGKKIQNSYIYAKHEFVRKQNTKWKLIRLLYLILNDKVVNQEEFNKNTIFMLAGGAYETRKTRGF